MDKKLPCLWFLFVVKTDRHVILYFIEIYVSKCLKFSPGG